MTRIANANIVTAFSEQTIGTKVINPALFEVYLTKAIEATDFAAQRVPGQAFIPLPFDAASTVIAGCGKRTNNPADYVARLHRGEVGLYLKREHAAPVESIAVVVYTREAYLADPDVKADPKEQERLALGYDDRTHILVAVLAFAGPKSPLPRGTLLHNLAGGNKEAALYSADEIRAMAKATEAYWSVWAVVAD